MKKYFLALLIFIFSCCYINVNAETTYIGTVKDTDGVNIRSGPGTSYSKIATLSYKSTFIIVTTTKKNVGDSNCKGGWVQISYNGNTNRYVCGDCISISEKEVVNTKYSSEIATPKLEKNENYYYVDSWYARINENFANVRKGASNSYDKIESIYLGTEVKILSGPTSSTSGCSSGWYKVSYYNNKTGYVCASLVDFYDDVTAYDKDYTEELKKAGFPDSYIPYLTYLHQKHPNWKFVADNTKKNYSTAVTSETGKNYTQSTYDVYRLSNTLKENPNWYAASKTVVAFYLDPRNYLNEKNIFAFETLSYDKTNHTRDILESIFSGTYLVKNSDNVDYVKYFMEAAESYNISPVHLATRVKQEGGTSETYDGVSGTSPLKYDGKSLKGFYNYYNIGAYQDSKTTSAVARGLATAAGYVDSNYGTPWNTREKAIKYGAKWIADGYINKGQDTMYYQKFNTKYGAKNSAYTHQYMTNIIAPLSESLSTYSAYKNLNLLNTAYTFSIPIYTDMPTNYTALPPIGNTNNDLKEIKINDIALNGFDSDVITYDYYVTNETTSIKISATASASTSSIGGTGTINLKDKTTKVEINVTSQIGTIKTYTVNIIKTETSDEKIPTVDEIINASSYKLSNNYLTNIEVGTTGANIINILTKIYPNAKIGVTDKNNKSKTTTLVTGDVLTIISGNDTKTYHLSIKGDINGDGKINSVDLLRVQKQILGYMKLTDEYKAAADVNYDGKINSVDLLRVQKHILGYITIK